MSLKHRVKQAVVKLEQDPSQNWAYETWSTDTMAYFSFESTRSAQLVSEALRQIFKSQFKQPIHNGRKFSARGRK
jgi:hypothetical protein